MIAIHNDYKKTIHQATGTKSDFISWQAWRRPLDYAEEHAEFDTWNHPLTQAQKWGISPLYYWQRRLLHYACMPKSRVGISTNNSSGKTSEIVPLLGLGVMAAFPGAVVLSTAGAEEQIRGQLWKYLEAKCRPYEWAGWKVKSGQNLEVWGPTVDGIRSRWIGRVPQQALTMEGYHQFIDTGFSGRRYYRPILVILDEAKSLADDIFQAFHRIDPDWGLVISTPADSDGPFHECIDPENLHAVPSKTREPEE